MMEETAEIVPVAPRERDQEHRGDNVMDVFVPLMKGNREGVSGFASGAHA